MAAEDASDESKLSGFLDSDGKWVTLTELSESSPDIDAERVEECVEGLVEDDIVRAKRNDDGDVVTLQLTPFATDLYALPDDASADEAIAVYVEHGKEPPECLREEYLERMKERAVEGDLDEDPILGGGPGAR